MVEVYLLGWVHATIVVSFGEDEVVGDGGEDQ